jgi:threonine dehydratase
MQITHSFKLRGAVNKFLSLSEEEKQGHLVTASSGNHGSAFAHVMKRFGARGTIYLPENASPAKVETLRLYGAELVFHGDDCIKSEMLAKQTAQEKGSHVGLPL